ncbi:flavoprotein [Azospirillum argentinense]
MPSIVFGMGGTLDTSLMPYRLTQLRAFLPQLTVRTALSVAAERFATSTALRGITGTQVATASGDPFCAETGMPLHLSLADADMVVVFPATPRILVEAALGSISCPVTRLVAFARKEGVVVCPSLHPRLVSSVYAEHLERLTAMGCLVLPADLDPAAGWKRIFALVSARFPGCMAADATETAANVPGVERYRQAHWDR